MLVLECKIHNVSCAELTMAHKMTFYCYSRNSCALRNLRRKCFLIYHKIQPFIIAIKTLNPSMKQLGKNCGFHLRKKKKDCLLKSNGEAADSVVEYTHQECFLARTYKLSFKTRVSASFLSQSNIKQYQIYLAYLYVFM